MSEDKKIRESLFKKDKDFNQKIKEEMEQEENMLKSYFKQYKQPVGQDPTIMKRQVSQQRKMFVQSVLSPFRVFQVFYEQYWNMECATPEERYILNHCKDYTKKQIVTGILGSLSITSLVSYQMRMVLSPKFHVLGFFVGLSSGFLYGVLSSTQYTLQRFQSLGSCYLRRDCEIQNGQSKMIQKLIFIHNSYEFALFESNYQRRRNSYNFYLNPKNMKRPQSAKPGFKGYWGQASADDINQQSIIAKNNPHRKQVKIMRPDLTTHDFARILPKKIPQDKQRLYSEALQLKQSLNEVMEENIRLKTKISILQKEKDKMNRYFQTAPEGLTKQGNSRQNIYGQKSNQKENNIIRNLKKIVRQSKDEVQYLKMESQKIKKTIKYTKINELEIERKTVIDENKKLSALLQEYSSQILNQDELERQNGELKKYLEEEIQQNKQLSEETEKYQQIIESLQEKIRAQNDKYQTKQKKLARDLALEKRKVQQQQKHIEDLRRQLKALQANQQQAFNMKKKQTKPLIRPNSSHPNNYKSSQPAAKDNTLNIQIPLQDVQTEQIKHKNEQLEKELKQIKLKLEQSENELNKRKVKDNMFKQNNEQKSEHTSVKPQVQEKSIIKKNQQSQKGVEKLNRQGSARLQKKYDFEDSPQKEEQSYANAFEPPEQSYDQQFQKPQQMSKGKQPQQTKKSKQSEQIQKLKKDFQQNQEEEQLYKKEPQVKKKKGDEKKKKEKTNKGEYKADKKILSEIKELLTYRMKSQRYPFQDLKADIETAESSTFTYADLCNMLVNEPFYLTSQYTKTFLCYCYQKEKISQNEELKKQVLISKLRKVIDNFQLMEQNQQKEMILRIAEMTSTYPYQLQTSFEKIKNGEETVSRKDLYHMFQQLELEDKYIELIIAELSLCSDDLEHLNFHGFFQRFYVEQEDGYNDNNAIEEQGEESEQSHKNTSRIKKNSKNLRKPSEQLEEKMGKYMLAPEQSLQNKNYAYEDEDIVSDDGRI